MVWSAAKPAGASPMARMRPSDLTRLGLTRFTQAGTQVHQTRGHHQPVGCNGLVSSKTGGGIAHGKNAAIGNGQVGDAVDTAGRVQDASALNQQVHFHSSLSADRR